MEDKRSPIDDPPQKVSSQYDLPAPEQLGGKPEADMGASPVPEPPPPTRGGRSAITRTKSTMGKSRSKTAKSAKSNREKLDQKGAGAADVSVGKHLEQPVDIKAPEIQRQKLGHKETGATEIPDGKRYENALEPVDTMAQERRRAEEADRAQSIPLVVPSAVPKLKQLLKKRRKSVSGLLPRSVATIKLQGGSGGKAGEGTDSEVTY